MSREIRRVPPDWQHPRKPNGHYLPLFDDYAASLAEYQGHPEWYEDEPPPDPADHMPQWSLDEATAFQVYETVSEGTPISPVLADEAALIDWLMNDGSGLGIGGRTMPLTRHQAESFARRKSAPSMIYSEATGLVSGLAAPSSKKDEPRA